METRLGLSPLEKEQILQRIRAHIVSLWQTDEVRNSDLTVLDEVKIGLYYMEHIVFPMIPRGLFQIRGCLKRGVWRTPKVPHLPVPLLRILARSDRDGNPNVTPELTVQTARLLHDSVVKLYDQRLYDLTDRLSQSTHIASFSKELLDSVEREKELFPDLWEENQ